MVERRQYIVVGAGLVGLAVTRELARRGRDVLCLERETIGHERGGSKGTSRIFRAGYPDALYVEMAGRSFRGWQALSDESGRSLLEPTGLLSFGDQVDEVAAAMAAGGAALEILDEVGVADRFPGIAVSGRAVFEPGAGVLRADEVLSALAHSARSAGGEILEHVLVSSIEDREDSVRIAGNSVAYDCDAVILCAGPWSAAMGQSAGLATARMFRPTLQQVAYLRPMSGSVSGLPAFVERAPVTCYGLPVPALGTYKVGVHDPGPAVAPGPITLDDDARDLEVLATMAARVLPGFEPEPVVTERCYYDNTADEHFVIDRVGRVVIGAGTSGHGFKFGPVWGEVLADLAEGQQPSFPIENFSISRAGLSREPGA
jgi:sarcosine oxidase